MMPILTIITATAFAALMSSCGTGNGSMEESPPPEVVTAAPSLAAGLTGTWTGTGVDSNEKTGLVGTSIVPGTTVVTWTMKQTDASISGTVTTQSNDPPGTCNSCHRSRTGALSGTISGTTLTWALSFPADAASDPTPTCTAIVTGTTSLSNIEQGLLNGLYAGEDLCEGKILDGTVTMARQP